MKPVFIFRHLEIEGPGYLEQFLYQKGIPTWMICVDQNEAIPQSLDKCSGLIFMGGPMSVNDDLDWIKHELELIRQAVKIDMPVLGHCLGGQLISKALGGEITSNPVKEIGWLKVEKEETPEARNWFNSLPNEFDAFHWHGETFSIPEGATSILSSKHCDHQAFALNNTLALQCHIEMTEEMVKEWAIAYAEELQNVGDSVQSPIEITRNLEQRVLQLNIAANVIYEEWSSRLK